MTFRKTSLYQCKVNVHINGHGWCEGIVRGHIICHGRGFYLVLFNDDRTYRIPEEDFGMHTILSAGYSVETKVIRINSK